MAKIFVIEDSTDVMEMIATALRSFGHEIMGSASREDFISNISDFKPRLVLLNIGYGHTYSRELYTKIKTIRKDLPVLLTSIDGTCCDIKTEQTDEFIKNPFDTIVSNDKR